MHCMVLKIGFVSRYFLWSLSYHYYQLSSLKAGSYQLFNVYYTLCETTVVEFVRERGHKEQGGWINEVVTLNAEI